MALWNRDDRRPFFDAFHKSPRPAAINRVGLYELCASFAAPQFPLIDIGEMLATEDDDRFSLAQRQIESRDCRGVTRGRHDSNVVSSAVNELREQRSHLFELVEEVPPDNCPGTELAIDAGLT